VGDQGHLLTHLDGLRNGSYLGYGNKYVEIQNIGNMQVFCGKWDYSIKNHLIEVHLKEKELYMCMYVYI
jgi:hypothetical protein